MLFRRARKVIVKPWNPRWASHYNGEAERLRRIFGPVLVSVEHIGSTSVPGLAAKPIIDILVTATSLEEVERLTPMIEREGYASKGEQGVPGRRYFRKGSNLRHTHHVHVYRHGDSRYQAELLFRDFLRAHPERAREYQELKQRLAILFRRDPGAYTEGKTDFIKQVLAEAAAWSGRGA
jgi:GrpB-like predicted nucleotidyltransferase (UPF0157 family)